MTRYCDACGAPVGDDDLFCIKCGARLAPAKPKTAPKWEPGQQEEVIRPVQPPMYEPKVAPEPVTAVPQREQAGSLAGLYTQAPADEADSATVVYDDGEDPDAPTFVFEPEPVLVLVRKATGEELTVRDGDVLGKGTKATVQVSGNHGISRQHLRFTAQDKRYAVEDLDSTNGTFIDGERLEPHVPHEIVDGTQVKVADEEFEFQVR